MDMKLIECSSLTTRRQQEWNPRQTDRLSVLTAKISLFRKIRRGHFKFRFHNAPALRARTHSPFFWYWTTGRTAAHPTLFQVGNPLPSFSRRSKYNSLHPLYFFSKSGCNTTSKAIAHLAEGYSYSLNEKLGTPGKVEVWVSSLPPGFLPLIVRQNIVFAGHLVLCRATHLYFSTPSLQPSEHLMHRTILTCRRFYQRCISWWRRHKAWSVNERGEARQAPQILPGISFGRHICYTTWI